MDGEGTAILEEVVREGFFEFVTIKDHSEEVNYKDSWGKRISQKRQQPFVHSFLQYEASIKRQTVILGSRDTMINKTKALISRSMSHCNANKQGENSLISLQPQITDQLSTLC